ncbi:MAG: C69 family dipeptidase [Bacteroidetes bacterium]|nr:C69 family dipeptidase [Bacteroidota bacterium]
MVEFKQFIISFSFLYLLFSFHILSQNLEEIKFDWEGGYPDGCTTIMVGKLASFDGSVMTSHTDDSHRTRSWMDIVPAKEHKLGETVTMYKREKDETKKMPTYNHVPVGEIPQVDYTNGYINSAYPCINDKQLAVGETTFGGKEVLKSDKGLIDCQRLIKLMLERTSTARDAIKLAGKLLEEFGWNDWGEILTIADPKEAWVFEVLGAGKDKVGAVWVAQRVPDEHIFVAANGSRIREIQTDNPDYFMYSKNIFDVAKKLDLWNPEDGSLEFCYAYASRKSLAARRREWRVFDLVAPSLKLDPYSENYPFSVKPENLVTLQKMVEIFSDYYENTPFNFIKDLTVTDDSGKTVLSPLANPFMPYDGNKLFKINGGWGWRGERTIARWYTMYATIIQCRDWLPNEIGGLVWMALDNVATSIYVPMYCSVKEMPKYYSTPGRVNGYSQDSGWWAFNRLSTLTAQRWGDMRYDVREVWDPWQEELFTQQASIESEALELYKNNPETAARFLTKYFNHWGNKVVGRAWQLGDELWTKYDEKF